MKLQFGETLARAWTITWKHKELWFFGILVSLGNGLGGSNGTNSQRVQFDPSTLNLSSHDLAQLQLWLDKIRYRFDPNIFPIIAVAAGILLMTAVAALLALRLFGQGGLVGGILLAADGQYTFREAWGAGWRNIPRLAGLWALLFGGGVAAYLVAALPGAASAALGGVPAFLLVVLCVCPLVCAAVLFTVLLVVLGHFAQLAIIVERKGILDALRRAWEVLSANLGAIIILGLILLLVESVVGFVSALPVAIAVIPLIPGLLGFALGAPGLAITGVATAVLCCAGYLPVMLVIRGTAQTWVTSSWTLAYQQFVGPASPVPSE